jgi:hypothetical protein
MQVEDAGKASETRANVDADVEIEADVGGLAAVHPASHDVSALNSANAA